MRILHFISSIDQSFGGTSAYMQLLAKELGKLVDLHIATHGSENMLSMENAQIHSLPGNAYGWRLKQAWIKLLDEIRPDVVHMNCCWLPEISKAQRWALQKGYKVILTPHGMLEPWIMKRHYWTRKKPALLLYQRKAIENADFIHVTAESEHNNILGSREYKVDDSRVKIIPNGVNVGHIEMKHSWKKNKNILFLSRVHPKKGINFLIEAVARIKEEMSGYIITIAGESFGEYDKELKRLAWKCGVSDMFKFIGGVYGDNKWRLYREADLFVLPTHSENFGIVIAEALACGTPVITTKGTPWKDLEENGCGWWTEIGIEPTIDALRDFLTLTVTELETMGRNGRKLVEEKYSAKGVATQFVEMYSELLGK